MQRTFIYFFLLINFLFLVNVDANACFQSQFYMRLLNNYECIDTAQYEVRYDLKFKDHADNVEYNEDVRVVQIGSNVVKDYSAIDFTTDSLTTINQALGKSSPSNSTQTLPCDIYMYHKEQRCDMKYHLIFYLGTLSYTNNLPSLQFTILPDTMSIGGYVCNVATTHFAGRDYKLWYTLDIPLPFGPYKFGGLPGLILKVEEANNLYIWEMISFANVKKPINLYKYLGEQKCSAKEAARTIKRMKSRPMTFGVSSGRRIMVKQSDGSWRPSSANDNEEEQPYQPLELE